MADKPYPSPEPTNKHDNAPFYVTSAFDIHANGDSPTTAPQTQTAIQEPVNNVKQPDQHQDLLDQLSQSLRHNEIPIQGPANAQIESLLDPDHGDTSAADLIQNARTALGLNRGNSHSPFQAFGGHRPPSDTPETSAAAKNRSKVSRACDDCRRKKIRCDAATENGITTCTSCRKAGVQCVFARQPQKRGPSKGYIKELADRVTTLEGQLKHNAGDEFEVNAGDSNFDIDPNVSIGGAGTKRSHSMLESLNEHYNATTRNGYLPQSALRYDEDLANLYYQYVHPYLPFLPSGGSPSLRELLMNIPVATKLSLLAALDCTLRSPAYGGHGTGNSSTAHAKADEMSRAALYADPIGLPHLQSLLLLALDSANRGAVVIQGGHGPRPGSYIAQAMEEAKTLDLFNHNVIQRSMDENALSLARSIAMSVSVLDVVTTLANKKVGSRPVFPSSITMSGDLSRVGSRLYWFGRAIHRLVDLSTTDVEPREGNEGRINDQRASVNAMKKIFMTSLEEYKETSGMDKDSLLGLAFWYVWGHMELYFWPLMESSNLFYALRSIIKLLESEQHITPFTHHFSGFAAHVLFQLAEFSDTREQAFLLLAQLDVGLHRLVPQSNTQSFDAAIRDSVSRRRSSVGESSRPTSPALEHDILGGAEANGHANDDQEEMQASPADDGGVAAAAAAAAKAVQLHMGSANLKPFAPDRVSQEGYLYALLG